MEMFIAGGADMLPALEMEEAPLKWYMGSEG